MLPWLRPVPRQPLSPEVLGWPRELFRQLSSGSRKADRFTRPWPRRRRSSWAGAGEAQRGSVMNEILYLAAGLAMTTAAVAVAARRSGLSTPILLVIAGMALALVPGLPTVGLAPDLVLLLFLPPIIYQAAFAMSWQAFRANLQPRFSRSAACSPP